MWDATLVWGGDLTINATGDLQLSTGTQLGQQRVLRRLLTNAADYIWQPDYGAGLGQFVGAANIERAAAGVIYAQVFLEPTVSRQPPPTVAATTMDDGSVVVGIQYVDAPSAQTQTVSFSMSA